MKNNKQKIYSAAIFVLMYIFAFLVGRGIGYVFSQTATKEFIRKAVDFYSPVFINTFSLNEKSGVVKGILFPLTGYRLDKPRTIINSESLYVAAIGPDIPVEIPMEIQTSSVEYEEITEETYKKDFLIRNETDIKIDIDKILSTPLKIGFLPDKSMVAVYHSHTTESFVEKIEDIHNSEIYTRSMDNDKNIVSVGRAFARRLESYKIKTIHNITVHDYPDFNQSYSNAHNTARSILNSFPETKFLIDIHRDAAPAGNVKLRRTAEINGETVAKIMFVVTTGQANNLSHPHWEENLKLAVHLASILDEMYPGIVEGLYISKYRYNQHLSTGAMTIEIGAEGNLLGECIKSAQYLADALHKLIEKDIMQ